MKTLPTITGKTAHHKLWENVENGEMVHVFCQKQGVMGGRPYAKGNFQVIDKEKRMLADLNRSQGRTGWFYCNPEWLYSI